MVIFLYQSHFFVFFFKQKTAYEMRISDWSSDVCSSDLLTDIEHYWYVAEDKILRDASIDRPVNLIVHSLEEVNQALGRGEYFWVDIARDGIEIGRASGRERVCQYV